MGNDKDTWVAGMLIQIIYSKTKQNYKRNITRRCIIQFRVKKHTCSLKGGKDVDETTSISSSFCSCSEVFTKERVENIACGRANGTNGCNCGTL